MYSKGLILLLKKNLATVLLLLFAASCCTFVVCENVRLSRFEDACKGLDLYYAGQYSEALPRLNELLLLDPHMSGVTFMIANCLVETGQYGAAISKYKRAFRTEHGTAFDHLYYGQALKQIGMTKDAKSQWKEALSMAQDERTKEVATLAQQFLASTR